MIRLCILQAGDKNPKLRKPVPGYAELYRAMFAPHPQFQLEFIQVRHGEFPESIDDWDAFLITGSPAGIYDELDWITTLRELIERIAASGKPLIGICFGHQIIADTLGGKAVKSDKGWGVGVRKASITAETGMLPGMDSMNLICLHQDQVIKAPEGARVFAGDDFCPIAAYSIDDRVLCFQGHPEFTTEVVDAIMDYRADDIGAERVAQARASLTSRIDGAEITRAIVAFIEESKSVSVSSVA